MKSLFPRALAFVVLVLLALPAFADLTPAHAARRLKHNQPDLVVDLGVGLWAIPLPMDFDGDGDLDLLVSCADVPARGLHYFENDGSGVFKPAVVLDSEKRPNVTLSYVDGKPRVCEPGVLYEDFTTALYGKPAPIAFKPDFHIGRANQWRAGDYDGDGVTDLILGISDWREYGWDDAYDAQGRWTAGPLHGFVYLVRNSGTNDAPVYGEAVKIEADGKPIDVFGCPSPNLVDWDGDGDLDLVCGSFLDTITLFENTGTRTAPVYAAGKALTLADGAPLRMELQMLQVAALDWDGDGDPDLVVGKEDGRVAWVENLGGGAVAAPVYFKQRAEFVKCGALAAPAVYDWDNDGDEDILCGNTAGFIEFIANLGGDPVRWAAPVRLTAGGGVIRFQAGPNLSIQGPAEAKWGYTTLSVGDWDGDGLPDIVCNSIIGRVVWFRNVGAPGKPELAPAEPLRVAWEGETPKPAWLWWTPEPGELVTQWRTTPVMLDWNRDGLQDLVMLDHEGFLAFFERTKRGDKLALLPGRRVFTAEDPQKEGVFDSNGKRLRMDLDRDGVNDFLTRAPDGAVLYRYNDRRAGKEAVRSAATVFENPLEKGTLSPTPESAPVPVRMNAAWAGGSGRRKITLGDWDGDGRVDVLVNGPCVNLLQNVADRDGCAVLRDGGPLVDDVLAGHDTAPALMDLEGDGKKGLLVGAEDGFLYYYPR